MCALINSPSGSRNNVHFEYAVARRYDTLRYSTFPRGVKRRGHSEELASERMTHRRRERISRTPRPSFRLSSVRSVTPSE
jgi:hypothetical protein